MAGSLQSPFLSESFDNQVLSSFPGFHHLYSPSVLFDVFDELAAFIDLPVKSLDLIVKVGHDA